MRKYSSAPKIETAIVKNGVRIKYIEGDTTPPSRIRRCVTCGERYACEVGRLCGCWEKEYQAFKTKETT